MPTPFESEHVTLYLGDSMEVLPQIPCNSVDLLTTDPPYLQGWSSGYPRLTSHAGAVIGDGDSRTGRDGDDISTILGLAIRRLRSGRHLYVFGGLSIGTLPITQCVDLIWDKTVMGLGDLSSPWGPSHERITFATRRTGGRGPAVTRGGLSARLRQGTILHVPRPKGAAVKRHATEKPVVLMRQLIESSSVIGETVLDPFAGSGSTLVAAVLEGRRAIGIELSPRCFDVAARRVEAAEVIAAQILAA